jgi:hypothetical protein
LNFTLKHYQGHPAGTATVYLPHDITDIEYITNLVSVILADLGIESDALIWQRVDDPEV